MRKDIIIFGVTIALMVLVTSGFKVYESTTLNDNFYIEPQEKLSFNVLSKSEIEKARVEVPFTGKTFVGFKEAIAKKESAGFYDLINAYGYMGKYQFGKTALRTIGIHDFKTFLQNPIWQEKAFEALLSINKWELRREIKKYSGTIIKGVKITESGLLAAAHLGGANSVKAYLRSNGSNGFKDGFGTSIKTYIKRFKDYDTSQIPYDRYAKVNLSE